MRKGILVISILSFSISLAAAQLVSLPKPQDVVTPPAKNDFYPIHEIYKQPINLGTYETEGYVIHVEKPNTMVIAEANKRFVSYDSISDKELIIFSDDMENFVVGTKYKFLIQVLDVKTTKQELNNIKLVYSEKLEEKPVKKLDQQSTLVP